MASQKLTLAIVVVAIAALTQSGCMTLKPMTTSKAIVAEDESQSANGMYKVDMVPLVGKRTSFQGQIRNNMTVQNALEESGALKKIRNAKITCYRIVQGTGRPLTLPVNLQSGKRLVRFEEDYSLHSGDRIVIEAKNSTGLDQVFESLFPKAK